MSGIGEEPEQELKGELNSRLAKLIKEDLKGLGRLVAGFGYGFVTPFVLWTGLSAVDRAMRSESVAGIAGLFLGLFVGHAQFAYWAIKTDRGKEYLGAFLALNAADYIWHLAKRYLEK